MDKKGWPHLKLVLLAAQVGALLLPEVVRLDDMGGVDGVTKMVLQNLKKGEEMVICVVVFFLFCFKNLIVHDRVMEDKLLFPLEIVLQCFT